MRREKTFRKLLILGVFYTGSLQIQPNSSARARAEKCLDLSVEHDGAAGTHAKRHPPHLCAHAPSRTYFSSHTASFHARGS